MEEVMDAVRFCWVTGSWSFCAAMHCCLQFLRLPLSQQPCERLLASPKRQLLHEGSLALLMGAAQLRRRLQIHTAKLEPHTPCLLFKPQALNFIIATTWPLLSVKMLLNQPVLIFRSPGEVNTFDLRKNKRYVHKQKAGLGLFFANLMFFKLIFMP